MEGPLLSNRVTAWHNHKKQNYLRVEIDALYCADVLLVWDVNILKHFFYVLSSVAGKIIAMETQVYNDLYNWKFTIFIYLPAQKCFLKSIYFKAEIFTYSIYCLVIVAFKRT